MTDKSCVCFDDRVFFPPCACRTQWRPVTGRRRRRAAAAARAVGPPHRARVAAAYPRSFSLAATAAYSRGAGPPQTSPPRSLPRSRSSCTHPFMPPIGATNTDGGETAVAHATASFERSFVLCCKQFGSQYLLSVPSELLYISKPVCGGGRDPHISTNYLK